MSTVMRRPFALVMIIVAALFLGGCAGAAPLLNGANYVTALADQTQRAGASISMLSGLVGNPQLADAAWRQQVSQEIAALRVVAGEARALTPPEALAGPHQSYLDALTQLDQTLITVEGALSAGDPARLRAAVPLLAEAQGLLTAAQELMGAGGQ